MCVGSYEVEFSDFAGFTVATTCTFLFPYVIGSVTASTAFDMYFFSLSFSE